MKRPTPALLAGAAAVIAFSLLFFQLTRLNDQIQDLQNRMDSLNREMNRQMDRLQGDLSGIRGDIREELERQASLFAQASTRLDYQEGQLLLEVSVIPREILAGETLSLSVQGMEDAVPLSPAGDGSYTGALSFAPNTEEVVPVITLRTATATRQEVLSSLWVSDLLAVFGQTDAENISLNDFTQFSVTLSPSENMSVSSYEDVVSFELLVDDEVNMTNLGSIQLRPDPAAGKEGLLCFTGDVSPYTQGEKYDLSFRAKITTAGGLTLTDQSPILSVSRNGNHMSSSSGDFELSPVW